MTERGQPGAPVAPCPRMVSGIQSSEQDSRWAQAEQSGPATGQGLVISGRTRQSTEPHPVPDQPTPPTHTANPHRQATPPSHSAKSLRQVTPPSHSARSLRQIAPPGRSARSHRQIAPPSHSAKSLRQIAPVNELLARGRQPLPPVAAALVDSGHRIGVRLSLRGGSAFSETSPPSQSAKWNCLLDSVRLGW